VFTEGGEEEAPMIPISLSWDTQKRSILLKWDGFFSFGWERGKVSKKVFGFSAPFAFEKRAISSRMRWNYLKRVFPLLTKWKLKKVEGTFSFPDPAINGFIYGVVSAIQTGKGDEKIDVTINFLGENRCRGEVILPPKALFPLLRRETLSLLWETKGKGRKGGET
jgi:hypothetical protein